MSEQKEQSRLGRLIIISVIMLAAVLVCTGCKKKPAEPANTEQHQPEPTQPAPVAKPAKSEPIGGSPVKPARPDTGTTTGSKVGLKNRSVLVESLTKDSFLQKVFNYDQNKEWKFEGKLPCIVDFYADWCRPCKMVEPILQELAEEYQGKLNIYRVDTEAQQELAAVFGIQSIPSMLFVPLNDRPQMVIGALPKKTLKKAIREVLKVE